MKRLLFIYLGCALMASIVFTTLSFGQQFSVLGGLAKLKQLDGEEITGAPSISVSFDNLKLDKESKKFQGFQATFFPEINVEPDYSSSSSFGGLRTSKFTGSYYFGRVLSLSKTFFISISAGGALQFSNIKSWDSQDNDWIVVKQFSVGVKASEMLHIRIKRGGIVTGFEQWLMIKSMNITFFKIGYAFSI